VAVSAAGVAGVGTETGADVSSVKVAGVEVMTCVGVLVSAGRFVRLPEEEVAGVESIVERDDLGAGRRDNGDVLMGRLTLRCVVVVEGRGMKGGTVTGGDSCGEGTGVVGGTEEEVMTGTRASEGADSDGSADGRRPRRMGGMAGVGVG